MEYITNKVAFPQIAWPKLPGQTIRGNRQKCLTDNDQSDTSAGRLFITRLPLRGQSPQGNYKGDAPLMLAQTKLKKHGLGGKA